jgi:hypothetical protein
MPADLLAYMTEDDLVDMRLPFNTQGGKIVVNFHVLLGQGGK